MIEFLIANKTALLGLVSALISLSGAIGVIPVTVATWALAICGSGAVSSLGHDVKKQALLSTEAARASYAMINSLLDKQKPVLTMPEPPATPYSPRRSNK